MKDSIRGAIKFQVYSSVIRFIFLHTGFRRWKVRKCRGSFIITRDTKLNCKGGKRERIQLSLIQRSVPENNAKYRLHFLPFQVRNTNEHDCINVPFQKRYYDPELQVQFTLTLHVLGFQNGTSHYHMRSAKFQVSAYEV